MPVYYLGRSFASPPECDDTDAFIGRTIRYAPLFDRAKIPAYPIKIMRPELMADPDNSRSFLQRITPRLIDYGRRQAAARGLFRIYNAASYRFYMVQTSPAVAGDAPTYESSTANLNTFPDILTNGDWYLSMSYFNGLIDSGFLPVGPHGETYLKITISGGVKTTNPPSQPKSARLEVRGGGVIRIVAFYVPIADGVTAGTEWAISYTTDGTTPPSGSPSIVIPFASAPIVPIAYLLPAQANGKTVKVQLQLRNGTVYSDPIVVLEATSKTIGPSAPVGLQSWAGDLPNE